MSISKLAEATRLHEMGFGIHWIRPNSKAPIDQKWAGDNRDTIQDLKKKYQKGYNIGTKLGKPSSIEYDLQDGLYMKTGFLAVIDVDVKGKDKKHQKSAEAWVNENLPGLLEKCPITLSGRGSGSKHIWILVDRPIDSRKLYSCNEMVEVHMPSTQPSKRDVETLGKEKTDQGFRLRAAWEVDFMCAGRQVVLPPSIHPDSGKEYKWQRPINSPDDIPFVDIDELLQDVEFTKRVGAPKNRSKIAEFEIVDPDEFELEMRLKPELVDAIYEGSGVSDRSAMCLSIALSMVGAKFSDAEILGVLTNREYFIGDVAYEHSQSTHRQRAARWAFDYCVNKARHEADVVHHFDSEVEVYETLSPEKSKQQQKELIQDAKEISWTKTLDRTDADKLKATLKNLILILQNDDKRGLSEKIFILDMFSSRVTYGISTQWGGVAGEEVRDVDAVLIKNWFAKEWKIEPNVNLIEEAIVFISQQNNFHPVKDYLESLEWDGVPRLNTWLKTYLGAEAQEPYLTEVSRKFLVAAVSRIYRPGKKFDHMVIFEGLQGIGKSTVGRILAGDKWFMDTILNLQDKDSSLNLQGQWIVEMGELANLRKADVTVIKNFITIEVDKVRPPYGKRMVAIPRQCVFFGTTNDSDYLKDKTGNRRFWPVVVNEVDLEGLRRDRDQLWAEALFIHDMDEEKLFLSEAAEVQAKGEQDSRIVEDEMGVMTDILKDWKASVIKARKANPEKTSAFFQVQLKELFDQSGFSDEGIGHPPLKDFKGDDYRYGMAGKVLSRIGFKKVKTNGGKRYWRL